jgi:hypothetical protein
MGLWKQWGAWFTRGDATQAVRLRHGDADCVDELPIEPERPWGCGWFDSSLDLREGLAVIEHAGIDLHLAVAQMLVPGEATRTGRTQA